MIVYFADRKLNILGMASTELRDGLLIQDDNKEADVETGSIVFDFDLCYPVGGRRAVERLVEPGNYILRHSGGDDEFYTIINSETDTDKQLISVYSEDAGLDLLNSIVGSYENSTAHPVTFYVDMFAGDSGFEIGINEITDRSRALSWDGESTALERLLSIATQFDAEIGFSFDIRKLAVRHKYINIYRKRGAETQRELRVGQEISSIRVKRSIENLATGLEVTGGTPEGKNDPITLAGYSYDDGDFYISGTKLLSRNALEKWSRHQWHLEPDEQAETNPLADGIYYIRSALNSAKVMEVAGLSSDKGKNVQLFSHNGGKNQQWVIEYNRNNGYYTLKCNYSGKALDLAGGGTADMTNIRQWDVNGSKAQYWIIRDRGGGKYSIHTSVNDKAVDVAGGSTADKTNIRIYTYNGSNAQLFTFEKVSSSESGTGHIIKSFTYDTTSQSELCNRALSELKKICDEEINYEVKLADRIDDLRLGDTVTVIDREEELYLGARVLKISECESEHTQEITLGEYLIRDSGIASTLDMLAAGYQNAMKKRVVYTWFAYADDAEGTNITTEPDGKEYIGTAPNRLTEEVNISDPSIFTWVKVKGEQGAKGDTGSSGQRGTSTLKITTAPSSYTTKVDDYNPKFRVPLDTVELQSGETPIVGDIIEYAYYHYPVGLVKDEYVYLGARTSIRGATGAAGEDAPILRIDSSRGTVFKNNQVSTVLSVTIYVGGDRITNLTDLQARYGTRARLQWYWLRINDSDYGTIVASDSRLSNDGFSFELSADDVDTKVTFRCELITD